MNIEKGKAVAYSGGFTWVESREEAIAALKSKGLAFGWYNGEFITV